MLNQRVKPLEYRKEFDGLRAIAVIAVLIYHINTHYLPNGFLGVDIFLVISGFLITSIIQKSIQEKKFDIVLFLKKRFFRIYPAYFTVICLTLIATYILLPKGSVDLVKKSAIYSLIGIPNFFYFKNISESYFEITATYPLLHLWSLGLELQFYCVWSILLVSANQLKIKSNYVIIFLSLCSFFIAAYFYSNPTSITLFKQDYLIGKKFIFYLLPSRLWEFGIGALASIYMKKFDNIHLNHLFSTTGIILIVLSLCFLKETDGFSPYLALLPCLGTFLFIAYICEKNIFCNLFSSKLLVTLGIGSYSIYLWHYPIIEFFKYFYEPYDVSLQIITLTGIAFMAFISYILVENHYRNSKSRFSFSTYCASFFAFILLSYLYNQKELNSDFYKFTAYYPGSCLYHPDDPVDRSIYNFNKKKCTIGTNDYKPNVLVVGSSHSNSFVPFLSVFAKQYGFSFTNITANSTAYTKEFLLGEPFKHDPKRIELHAAYYKLIHSMESDFDILITCPSWADSEQKIFAETLEDWSQKFKMVILINHIPSTNTFKLMRTLTQKEIKFSSDNYSALVEQEAQKYANVFYVSLNNHVIESKGLDDKRHALFFDNGHLNIGGSMYLASKVIQDKNPNILKSSQFLDLAQSKQLNASKSYA